MKEKKIESFFFLLFFFFFKKNKNGDKTRSL